MPRKWRTTTLQGAGVTLLDCDHRTPVAVPDGYPYIAIPQLKSGRLDLGDVRRISQADFLDWTKKTRPQQHDVVLSRRCNPGETAVVPDGLECALGQNLVLLRSDGREVYPPFLRWLVRGPAWWEQVQKFINVGAVFDSLRCADVPKFEVLLPPVEEQRAIARILGSLDDRIELNRKTNETLEAMARALFRSWFIDFDQVRAKMAGRKPAGMNETTTALFPGSLEESALGRVPKGWNVGRLEDLVELRRGHDLPASARRAGPVPIVSSGGITGTHDIVQAKAPGIVTGRYGTLGKVFLMDEDYWPLNTTLYSSDLKGNDSVYVFHALGGVEFEKYSDKGAVPGINRNHLHMEPMMLPPVDVQRAFGTVVGVFRRHARALAGQSTALGRARDALLPKLMSGELRIPEAERTVAT